VSTPPPVVVDVSAAEPPYEQVRRQIAGHIMSGALPDGSRLPTIQALAADLGLAGNTVGRAYKELEAAGLVRTRRRVGTVVIRARVDGEAALARSAAAYARDVVRAGLDETAAMDLVRAALRAAGAGA
jgi:DNA-binding transcriptional regulator YhcF (GntR family)